MTRRRRLRLLAPTMTASTQKARGKSSPILTATVVVCSFLWNVALFHIPSHLIIFLGVVSPWTRVQSFAPRSPLVSSSSSSSFPLVSSAFNRRLLLRTNNLLDHNPDESTSHQYHPLDDTNLMSPSSSTTAASTSTPRGGTTTAAFVVDLPAAMVAAAAAAATAATTSAAFITPISPAVAAATTTTTTAPGIANYGSNEQQLQQQQQQQQQHIVVPSYQHQMNLALEAAKNDYSKQQKQQQQLIKTTPPTSDWWRADAFLPYCIPTMNNNDNNNDNFLVPDVILAPRYSLRQTLQVSPWTSRSIEDVDDDDTATATTTTTTAFRHTWKRPAVVGHRGALYDALENTREAFQRCVELQCQAVELDVFAIASSSSSSSSNDNDPTTSTPPTLVVFHGSGNDDNPGLLDEYFIQQAPGQSILDLTYPETQQLQFNVNHKEFPCPPDSIVSAKIPTLAEVLQDLKGTGVQIKIELKGPNTVEPVLELVEQMEMTNQCSYSSFDHSKLQHLRALRPDTTKYPTGALFGSTLPANFITLAEQCGATAVHLQYDTCTAERIDQIRDAGMQSMAWFRGPVGMAADTTMTAAASSSSITSSSGGATMDNNCSPSYVPFLSTRKYWDVGNEDEACYRAVLDTGVDEMCVNRPDVLLKVLDKLEQQHVQVNLQPEQQQQQHLYQVASSE